MIAAAAIPLFLEHGAALTTRQLADQLGIAEGTIFRAFGDKDALVRGVVDAFFDHADQSLAPELADPDLPLAEKLRVTIRDGRARARGVFAMISLLEPGEAHDYMKQRRHGQAEKAATIAFAADADEINMPPERVDALIRLLVIAASAPHLCGGTPPSDDELVDFALYGIVGRPASDDSAADDSASDDSAADAPRRD